MAHRTHGEGTINKRTDGRWQGALQVNGKRQTVYGRTQREVREKLDQLRQQVRGTGKVPERHTLGDLFGLWLETGASRWAPRTAQDNREYANLILGELGPKTLLTRISPPQLQALVNRHTTTSRRRAQLIHQTLHAALTLALRWDWLPVNPMDKVERPSAPPKQRQWWTAEQCRNFVESTRTSRWWPLWVVALTSGLRLGELSALRWEDVDWDARILHVHRSGQWVNGVWTEKAPKTQAGRRLVPVGTLTLDALHQQRAQQAQWCAKAGESWTGAGMIFTTLEGRPLRRFDVAKTLRQAVRRLNLPDATMHTLRHLAASLALQEGAPLPLVSRHLGHSSVGITASVYSHAVGNGQVVGAAVERALLGGSTSE